MTLQAKLDAKIKTLVPVNSHMGMKDLVDALFERHALMFPQNNQPVYIGDVYKDMSSWLRTRVDLEGITDKLLAAALAAKHYVVIIDKNKILSLTKGNQVLKIFLG